MDRKLDGKGRRSNIRVDAQGAGESKARAIQLEAVGRMLDFIEERCLGAKRSHRTRVVILEKLNELKKTFIARVDIFVRGCVFDINRLPQGARNALVYQNNANIVGDNVDSLFGSLK